MLASAKYEENDFSIALMVNEAMNWGPGRFVSSGQNLVRLNRNFERHEWLNIPIHLLLNSKPSL